jgi:UDP-glucose 4-epimerase
MSVIELPLLGTRRLLEAMLEARVDRIVLSLSCSVIGTSDEAVTEEPPTQPESPYGDTKLVCEWLLRDVDGYALRHSAVLQRRGRASAGARRFRCVQLDSVGLPGTLRGRPPQVFGDDLARAHVAPAKRLETEDCAETYNVGRGEGSSVKEVMHTVCKVLGRDFGYVIAKRRPGDPTKVVGVVDKIRNELGWVAEHDLESMVRSAWQAWGLGCPLLTDYPHADGWRALAVLPCQRFHWGCRAVGDFFQ